MNRSMVRLSRFLSLVLRHKPETIGISLDHQGWVDVATLLEALRRRGIELDETLLREIVATNPKQRFALSDDGRRIRANQGHSLAVDLALPPVEPPARLFHGTATRFLDSIRTQGLIPGSRTHVHLSTDEPTAILVGRRHGVPVVLTVDAVRMHADGYQFYQAENGVWLTAAVPPVYIGFPEA